MNAEKLAIFIGLILFNIACFIWQVRKNHLHFIEQIYPEKIILETVHTAETPRNSAHSCMQIGPFNTVETIKTQQNLQKLTDSLKNDIHIKTIRTLHLRWRVQLSPIAQRDQASQLQQQLLQAGFNDSMIISETYDNTQQFLLSLGVFSEKARAEYLLQQIKHSGFIHAQIQTQSIQKNYLQIIQHSSIQNQELQNQLQSKIKKQIPKQKISFDCKQVPS